MRKRRSRKNPDGLVAFTPVFEILAKLLEYASRRNFRQVVLKCRQLRSASEPLRKSSSKALQKKIPLLSQKITRLYWHDLDEIELHASYLARAAREIKTFQPEISDIMLVAQLKSAELAVHTAYEVVVKRFKATYSNDNTKRVLDLVKAPRVAPKSQETKIDRDETVSE